MRSILLYFLCILLFLTISFLGCIIHEVTTLYNGLYTNSVGMIIRHIYVNTTISSEKQHTESIDGPVSLKEFGYYEKNRYFIVFYLTFRI